MSLRANVLPALLFLALGGLLGWLVVRGTEALVARLRGPWALRVPALRLGRAEVVPALRVRALLHRVARWTRLLLLAFLAYATAGAVLGAFPATEALSLRLSEALAAPLRGLGAAVVAYLPKLLALVVLLAALRAVLGLQRAFFRAVAEGRITFASFHADWAHPTHQIVRAATLLVALAVAFPYLPGADSKALQAVSVLAGVLLSLGSTGAVGNAVSGVLLAYMRAYRLGDYVAIGSAEGEVVARNLLVTRLRTIQNEDITLSNAAVLGGTVTNYTFAEDGLPVAARTAVTLGYDVPWRTAHALLLQAAAATPEVLAEPAPFVLQRSLDDFYVRYELSAHIPDPRRLRFVLSDLHAAIQDAFAAAGVEICSPHHAALRDGNAAAIPGAGPVPAERSFRVRNG